MNDNQYLLLLLVITILALLFIALYVYFHNPFSYPYQINRINITHQRNVNAEDAVDEWLCQKENRDAIELEKWAIARWKADANQRARSVHRQKQYQSVQDDEHSFVFQIYRVQTRYRQRNYVKTSYKKEIETDQFSCSYKWIVDRCEKLASETGYTMSLKKAARKNQRSLMTSKLRSYIAKRDHYTCQICGKYMPDGVGLQIDHIVPVAAGGKTVPDNLQVLCSKCNAKKGRKLLSNIK